jgi:predicted ATPase
MKLSTQYLDSLEFDNDGKPLSYPYNVSSIKNLKQINFHPKVTFLIGENGSGKSTLLEAIAVHLGFNPEGGSRNFNFSTKESHSELHACLKIKKGLKQPKDNYFFRAESFYNVATAIEQLDEEAEKYGGYGKPIKTFFGGKSLHEQSHGESFFTLLTKRFVGNGLYLFDEPEAALSPTRQLSMLTRLHDLCENKSQFIIATHSPILLAYPDAVIYQITENGVSRVNYEETEHFQVTKNFLNNREKMLNLLLELP